MKGLRAQQLKGLENLVVEDWKVGDPGEDQLRIAVTAAGTNYADLSAISGTRRPSPAVPFTPGVEVAGTVSAVGKGVKGFKVGDAVVAFTPWGGMAEQALAPASVCVALPKGVSAQTAACLPMAYAGALLALRRARLGKDDRLLVLGAASHLGLAAVEIGKALGAVVIAAASGDKRSQLPKEAGADHTFDPTTGALAEGIAKVTDKKGVTVVFDPVGGNSLQAAMRAITVGGRIIVAGFAAGKPGTLNPSMIYAKNVEVFGGNTQLDLALNRDVVRAALADVVKLAADGKIKPRIAAQFPLAQGKAALDYVKSRRGNGAVLVTMGK